MHPHRPCWNQQIEKSIYVICVAVNGMWLYVVTGTTFINTSIRLAFYPWCTSKRVNKQLYAAITWQSETKQKNNIYTWYSPHFLHFSINHWYFRMVNFDTIQTSSASLCSLASFLVLQVTKAGWGPGKGAICAHLKSVSTLLKGEWDHTPRYWQQVEGLASLVSGLLGMRLGMWHDNSLTSGYDYFVWETHVTSTSTKFTTTNGDWSPELTKIFLLLYRYSNFDNGQCLQFLTEVFSIQGGCLENGIIQLILKLIVATRNPDHLTCMKDFEWEQYW